MKSFEDLHIWRIGIGLVKEIYVLTKSFPADERYGITSQIRRASTSVLANFAEGYSRASPKDKRYKYVIARGECTEVKAFLLICKELGYISNHQCNNLVRKVDEIGRILTAFVQSQNQYKLHP